MKTLFLAFFLFISTLQTQAQESSIPESRTVEEFQQMARVIPQALLDNGYRHLGDLDLKKFLEDMNQVQVTALPWIQTQQSSDQIRIFARWERHADGPKVMVNHTVWQKSNHKQKDALALHEMLGAAGFEDTNYDLSTGLWMLAQKDTKEILSWGEMRAVKKAVAEAAKNSGGGVIGVGGGGDMIGPLIKISLLTGKFEDYRKDPSAKNRDAIYQYFFLTRAMQFEANWEVTP